MNAVARPLAARLPSLRALLVADALFELVVGIALLAPGSPVGIWLGSPGLATALGVVFLVAAAAIARLASPAQPDRRATRALTVANVVGGVALWVLVAVAWARLPVGARVVGGGVADACLALGTLELLALLLTASRTEW